MARYFDSRCPDAGPERLRVDAVLCQYFRERGFTGPAWEFFVQRLLGYGLSSVTALVRSEAIFGRCTRRGRPVNAERLPPADAEELASDVVREGFELFRREGLVRGGWRPDGGASLRSYFLNACVLVFPNAYRRWQTSRRTWQHVPLLDSWPEESLRETTASPERLVVARAAVDSIFRRLGENASAVMFLVDQNYTHAEIAEIMRITPRAVEARVRRARATAREVSEQEGEW
ncbi:RNA polymerase sigma factor [Umezawaea beigongshangensis]|uniref:RNA polymerase sigma factor n=1 Tax=Umezawaea beigongshangensis TaxID=2780383 RepID=UPI0018F23623|nr:sigma-70 family RNA polymerase sigma factor [Umezawaea beigongshangensis]